MYLCSLCKCSIISRAESIFTGRCGEEGICPLEPLGLAGFTVFPAGGWADISLEDIQLTLLLTLDQYNGCKIFNGENHRKKLWKTIDF
jgi:hypothetical protein